MAKMLDGMEAMLRGEVPPPAAATLLGMRLAAFSTGEALVELDATAAHANPMGTVQGGVLAAVADAAMGWAYMTTLGDGESYTTVEMKVNFLRAVRTGRISARARVKKPHARAHRMRRARRERQAGRSRGEHVHDPLLGGRPLSLRGQRARSRRLPPAPSRVAVGYAP